MQFHFLQLGDCQLLWIEVVFLRDVELCADGAGDDPINYSVWLDCGFGQVSVDFDDFSGDGDGRMDVEAVGK